MREYIHKTGERQKKSCAFGDCVIKYKDKINLFWFVFFEPEPEADMREQYLGRVNRLIFITHAVTTFFLVMGLVSQLTSAVSGMKPYQSIIPIIGALAVFLGGLVVFLRFRRTIIYTRYVGIAFAAYYILLLAFAASNTPFTYILPIMFILVFSFDVLIVRITAAGFFVANVLRIMLTASSNEMTGLVIESIMIEAIITILIVLASNIGVVMMKRFFDESMQALQEVSEKNESIATEVLDVAQNVEQEAKGMLDNLTEIADSTKTVNQSMDYVSQGINDTSELISQQNMKTQEITEIIDNTHEKTGAMVGITKDTEKALDIGREAMDKLFHHVEASIEANSKMKTSASELQVKSEEVKGITDIILGISNKTNLLALNASIEAARAGELGKGFAVVADEIRNLAEQTRQETENITSIIDALSTEAQTMSDQVDETVQMSNEESVYAKEADAQFEQITSKINELLNHVNEVETLMNSLVSSNTVISDSISSLSATSEEITASTHDVYEVSGKNVELVERFVASMEQIMQGFDRLRGYTEKKDV